METKCRQKQGESVTFDRASPKRPNYGCRRQQIDPCTSKNFPCKGPIQATTSKRFMGNAIEFPIKNLPCSLLPPQANQRHRSLQALQPQGSLPALYEGTAGKSIRITGTLSLTRSNSPQRPVKGDPGAFLVFRRNLTVSTARFLISVHLHSTEVNCLDPQN